MSRNTRSRVKRRKKLHQALRAWEEWVRVRLVQGGLKALGESGHKGYLDRRRGSGPPRIGRTWVHVQNPLVRSVFYSGRTGTMTEVGVDGSVSESYSVHKYQFYDRVRELDEVAFQQICFGGLSKPSK